MNIPSFDDFLAQVSNERMIEWAESANRQIPFIPNINTQEGAQRFFQHSVQSSMHITIAMMRDYHEWLIAELSKKSLHLL